MGTQRGRQVTNESQRLRIQIRKKFKARLQEIREHSEHGFMLGNKMASRSQHARRRERGGDGRFLSKATSSTLVNHVSDSGRIQEGEYEYGTIHGPTSAERG